MFSDYSSWFIKSEQVIAPHLSTHGILGFNLATIIINLETQKLTKKIFIHFIHKIKWNNVAKRKISILLKTHPKKEKCSTRGTNKSHQLIFPSMSQELCKRWWELGPFACRAMIPQKEGDGYSIWNLFP